MTQMEIVIEEIMRDKITIEGQAGDIDRSDEE